MKPRCGLGFWDYPDTLIPVEYFVLNFPVINLQQKAKKPIFLYIYLYLELTSQTKIDFLSPILPTVAACGIQQAAQGV